MSDYSDSLDNKLSICPCSSSDDIPVIPQAPEQLVNESTQSSDHETVDENGFSSDSEEEQDTLASQGYVPLGQSEDESTETNGTTEIEYVCSVNVANEVNNTPEQCEIVKPELLNETSSAFSSASDPTMSEGDVDLIKSVMMNIKIPTSSIPEWARKIPEEKWISPFVSSLSNRTSGEEMGSPQEMKKP